MWWKTLLDTLGDLFGNLANAVNRLYVETRVGQTRTLHYVDTLPWFWKDIDSDGSGNPDLQLRYRPRGLPEIGLEVEFRRIGAGVAGVSALLYIGVDGGVYPVGTPPSQMQFAFVGFEGQPGRVAPDVLKLFVRQQKNAAETKLTVEISAKSQATIDIRAGMVNAPVQPEPAVGTPGGSPSIRTPNRAAATELTDALLSLAMPTGGALDVTSDAPVEVKVTSTATATSVSYTAPEVLTLGARVELRGPISSHASVSIPEMPDQLSVSVSGTEAEVYPNRTLDAEVRGSDLPFPDPLDSFTSATARISIPALPILISWGPPPLMVSVNLKPGTVGTPAISLNALLAPGEGKPLSAIGSPPQPHQALVSEYIESHDLWVAVNALSSLRVSIPSPKSPTEADWTLTLTDPVGDVPPPLTHVAPAATPIPPRSIRLTAFTDDGLSADVRASQIDADEAGTSTGTWSGHVKADANSGTVQLKGRLRHLRALLNDGTGRNEVWTVATPPTMSLTYDATDGFRFSLAPDAPLAATADRTGALGKKFTRLFARVLLHSSVDARYRLVSRQPAAAGVAGAASTETIHYDQNASAFTPDLVGMKVRYLTGVNAGVSQAVTKAEPGVLYSEPFELTPSAGDEFEVVAHDAELRAQAPLPNPGTSGRQGISAVASLASRKERRLATRIHPQVVQQTSHVWNPFGMGSSAGDSRDAVAGRIEGVVGVVVPPPVRVEQGPLAIDLKFDPNRPRRSMRYAENRRRIFQEPVMEAILQSGIPAPLRPVPTLRALLADMPDAITIRQQISAAQDSYSLSRTGGSGQGWIWAVTEQTRIDRQTLAGIGVISLDIIALPQRLGVILPKNLADVRRRMPPNDIMWTPSGSWGPPIAQAVTISGGDLRIERVIQAAFWPGATTRATGAGTQSFPVLNVDQWDLTTASFVHLHDNGTANQRLTVWTLDSTDLDDPDRSAGIGIEAMGLDADIDLDRYRALMAPAVYSYASIPWTKMVELQLEGYTGAWLLSGESIVLPDIVVPDYERPAEDTGFWFLRAVDMIPFYGDAYFGNTSGNINGRDRPYP